MPINNSALVIKKIFSELEKDYAFFGLGVNAFNRLGPELFLSDYYLLTLRNPLENDLIEKDIPLFSLEKDMNNQHINAPRNSNTLIKHEKTQAFIQKKAKERRPVFLVYKPFLAMEKIMRHKDWLLCANPYRFGKKLFENKILFREILENLDLPVPPGEIIKNPSDLLKNFVKFKEKYQLPIVIQHPARGGGRGTFFVSTKEEVKRILPFLEGETLVLKFIQGNSPSITGCVTPWGIAYTYPQQQILDQSACYNLASKAGDGLWCGHDWTFSRFNQTEINQIYKSVTRVGGYLAKNGYRGIFGLDFIEDRQTGKIYVGECNPRLLGSFPVINMAQARNQEVPILALHILSFLKLSQRHHDIMRHIFGDLLKQMTKPKIGAQIVLHNKEARWCRNQNEIRPGIYCLDQRNELRFVREGYSLLQLRKKDEVLLCDGLPRKFSPFSPNRRIMRLITLNQLLKNHSQLSQWAETVAEKAYQMINLKPVKFFRLKRFFNPNFMAKG